MLVVRVERLGQAIRRWIQKLSGNLNFGESLDQMSWKGTLKKQALFYEHIVIILDFFHQLGVAYWHRLRQGHQPSFHFLVDEQISILLFTGWVVPFPLLYPTIIEFDPSVLVCNQGIIVAGVRGADVHDKASQSVLSWDVLTQTKIFWEVLR